MKHFALRTVFAASFAVLLTACGANVDTDLQTQTAATVTSVSAPVLAANDPVPDCAAEGCNSPRIVDANAETFRYDAMRRAAADPQS